MFKIIMNSFSPLVEAERVVIRVLIKWTPAAISGSEQLMHTNNPQYMFIFIIFPVAVLEYHKHTLLKTIKWHAE